MHIKPRFILHHHRQKIEKVARFDAQLVAGPFDGSLRMAVHRNRKIGNRAVVVADNRDRAVVDILTDGVDHPFGIGAIADIVTKKNIALDILRRGMRQTGFESLPVAVNVAQEGGKHGSHLIGGSSGRCSPLTCILQLRESCNRPP